MDRVDDVSLRRVPVVPDRVPVDSVRFDSTLVDPEVLDAPTGLEVVNSPVTGRYVPEELLRTLPDRR